MERTLNKLLEFDLSPDGLYEWLEFNKNDINPRTNKSYSAWEIKRRINFASQFLHYLAEMALNPKNGLLNSDYYTGLAKIITGKQPKKITKQEKTEAMTLKDVHNVLNALLDAENLPAASKLIGSTNITFQNNTKQPR
jgi:hypothetical protein